MSLDIDKLTSYYKTFGLPLYIFDEDAFVSNYHLFEHCFKSIYKNYRVSYSFKTNYAPYICRLVHKLGGYAEVVSDMELSIARYTDYKDTHIVYNGPCKGSQLEQFILNGGIVNVDNFEELERIVKIAEKNPKNMISFGLRANIDIGQSFISRVGIDEAELGKAFNRIKNVENAKIVGLHCHIGRSRSLAAWKYRTKKMLAIADAFFSEPPAYISLGSGMFGNMDPFLAHQFGETIPTYEEYADVVARPFATHYSGENQPILFTEPGTTLINSYVSFMAKVISIKHIKGKDFVFLDGSKHNLGEICEIKQLPIHIIKSSNKREIVCEADLVGYTCLEHDVLYKSYTGEIAVGDIIIFDNVGGYSNVSKPPFIKPNCYMISSNGRVIKKAETVKEVMSTYE